VKRFLLLGALLLACTSSKGPNPLYAPTENVLEVISVLRLHIDDDTYRFPPARDFTGKNIYRAVLRRLEALEELHAEKFRSGYLTDVILFAKARALERITEYDLAAQHYNRVLDLDSPLREDAYISKYVCETLDSASRIEPSSGATPGEAMSDFDRRIQMLNTLKNEVEGTHYVPVVEEESERAARSRAEYFGARRTIEPWLDVIALQQYQHLVQDHSESKNRNRHLLSLADLYVDLSRQYVRRFPPTSLGFDPATFDEYAFAATRLYEAVAQRDGAIEKIEAARKLEAFLAFNLQVYDEKLRRQ
jgi:tetratricopeptide (TPR) repeat protein